MKKFARVSRLLSSAMLTAGLACAALPGLAAEDPMTPEQEIAALKAEVAQLRGMLPAQAAAMTVVEYNFSNLWFAAHAQNWPLAQFFLSETRARLRWSLRISPERRISTGQVVLQPFLDVWEQNHFTAISQAMQAQDMPAFEQAYSNALGACHSCHAASEKDYLRLSIPAVPAGSLIDF